MLTIRSLCLLFAMALSASLAQAASKAELDAEVRQAIANFYQHTSAGKELAGKSSGMLVFPNVIEAGIGIGAEYGEGALLVGGKTSAYYNIAAASIGLQLGAQARSQIVLFMTPGALAKFLAHDPLCDAGRAYATRLKDEGVRVQALHLSDQIHGMLIQGRVVAASETAGLAVADWVGAMLRAQ